jgi:hypothetical protein
LMFYQTQTTSEWQDGETRKISLFFRYIFFSIKKEREKERERDRPDKKAKWGLVKWVTDLFSLFLYFWPCPVLEKKWGSWVQKKKTLTSIKDQSVIFLFKRKDNFNHKTSIVSYLI